MRAVLISIAVLSGVFLFQPTISFAQDLASFAGCTGVDCSTCNVVSMANEIIKWLIGFIFLLFAVLLAWAGFGLVTSGGDHHALDAAKEKFTNAIIGLIIILAAWLIVDTIMRGLVGSMNGNDGQVETATGWLYWSEVQCYTQTAPDEDVPPFELPPNWVPTTNNGGGTQLALTSFCTVLPGPGTSGGYDCSAQEAACRAVRGIPTRSNNGANVVCVQQGAPTGDTTVSDLPLISQPSGQHCFQSACFPAVTGIAGQPGYQYPSGFPVPPRWIDTENLGAGQSIGTRASPSYTLAELNRSGSCGNGGRYMYVDPNALQRVEAINASLGRKLNLNSVHRSPGCNARVGGAESSIHMSGRAFDIDPGSLNRCDIVRACRAQGAGFIMTYSGTGHVHCDWGPSRGEKLTISCP